MHFPTSRCELLPLPSKYFMVSLGLVSHTWPLTLNRFVVRSLGFGSTPLDTEWDPRQEPSITYSLGCGSLSERSFFELLSLHSIHVLYDFSTSARCESELQVKQTGVEQDETFWTNRRTPTVTPHSLQESHLCDHVGRHVACW